MRIARLLPDFPLKETNCPWFIDFGIEHEWATENFTCGNRILNWHGLEGTCSDGLDLSLDFMLSLNGWPLFSKKFQDLLDNHFPGSVQFLPVSFGSHFFRNNDTAIGQILHLVDAVDRNHTNVDNDDWTPRPNGTYRVHYPIHLRKSEALKFPIFRVPEAPVGIYIRNDLFELIQENQITGARLDFNVPLH